MAYKLPGSTGFLYSRFSSNNRRAYGKFTDQNHLLTLTDTDPVDYDKKIIQIYTQSKLYSNDFLNMINESDPYYIERGETWKWKIEVPFENAKIVDIPEATSIASKVGQDGQEFQLVLDTPFTKNETVILGHRQFGQEIAVVKDPLPYGRAFLHTFTLLSENGLTDFVDKKWLQVGMDVLPGTSMIGEFDTDLPGLGKGSDYIEMFESMSSAFGRSHRITKWAEETMIKRRGEEGHLMDVIMYSAAKNGPVKMNFNDVRWEPFIESLLRMKMLDDKVNKMIWGRAGYMKTNASKQELKWKSDGVYQRMRKHGNYVAYDRGDFSTNLIRQIFGDMFYRRVDVSKRRVKLYTNEAGFDVFQQAIKEDARNSGISLVADASDKFIQGSGQKLVYNWAFESMITRETGVVELVHLKELDQPITNVEYGQNKKSTPVFMVFNVSPDSDGSFRGNVREVRLKGAPSMTWGYVDGRISHLGHFASKGMSSANMNPWYEIWFEDRCDVFVEDLSRCVLIEEIPQF